MSQEQRILFADVDNISIQLVSFMLENEGFEIIKARSGYETLQRAREESVDIILAEAMLPDLNGSELCRALREDWSTRYIPIMLTTSLGGPEDRIEGLVAGADEFLIRPYDVRELIARLRRLISTYANCARLHPVTRLPSSQVIESYMSEVCLPDGNRKWAFLHIDINHFKPFNRIYGYQAGDDVLRMLGSLLRDVVHRVGTEFSFVGHDGGDDFVAVVPLASTERVTWELIERFNTQVLEHYPAEHRSGPHQLYIDRRGATQQVPRMMLSVGIVTSDLCQDLSYLELRDAGVAVLNRAKLEQQSSHYVNRRRLAGRAVAAT